LITTTDKTLQSEQLVIVAGCIDHKQLPSLTAETVSRSTSESNCRIYGTLWIVLYCIGLCWLIVLHYYDGNTAVIRDGSNHTDSDNTGVIREGSNHTDSDNTGVIREGSNQTPAHEYSDFRFRTYAPVAFRYFRELFGIQPDDFLVSLSRCYIKSSKRLDTQ